MTQVLPAVVLQQVSQGEIFEHVLNDAVLGSSIYVNIAVAGLTLLLFMYLGEQVNDPRGKLIVVSAMFVSAVSIVSYTGLASGLTIDTADTNIADTTISLPRGSFTCSPRYMKRRDRKSVV